jgi:mRNA interferase RelE/StbE
VKTVRYTTEALTNLKRRAAIATRVRKAIDVYVANPTAHANNVTRLVGSAASRMRVGDYRVIFVETATDLTVVRIGPHGGVFD